MDAVRAERGTPLRGAALTPAQKEQLYREGFVILQDALPSSLTTACKRRITQPTAAEAEADTVDKEGSMARSGGAGRAPEVLACINNPAVTGILTDLIGAFDPPADTVVAFVPPERPRLGANQAPGVRYNGAGYPDQHWPFFDAMLHMDGGTPGQQRPPPDERVSDEAIYWDYVHRYGPDGGTTARDAENGACFSPVGKPGHSGLLFMDKACSLSTGSFTIFAVACLNDQSEPGRGQFTVLGGAHHAMEKFYQMQYETGGILGPEGPGWSRLDYSAPNRAGFNAVPVPVRELFIDEHAQPSSDGRLWPQPVRWKQTKAKPFMSLICVLVDTIRH
jgi:hypothetical protein